MTFFPTSSLLGLQQYNVHMFIIAKTRKQKKPWHTLMFLSQNAGKEVAQPSKPKTQSKKAPPKKEVPKPSESEEEDDDDDDEDEEEEEEDADDVDDDGKLVILSKPSSLQSKTLLLVLCHCPSLLIAVREKKTF